MSPRRFEFVATNAYEDVTVVTVMVMMIMMLMMIMMMMTISMEIMTIRFQNNSSDVAGTVGIKKTERSWII